MPFRNRLQLSCVCRCCGQSVRRPQEGWVDAFYGIDSQRGRKAIEDAFFFEGVRCKCLIIKMKDEMPPVDEQGVFLVNDR